MSRRWWTVVAATVLLIVAAGTGPTNIPSGAAAGTGVLPPNVVADIHAGLRTPTRGPSPTPNLEGGIQLSILNGLLKGTPIYNGDFADPYAFLTHSALYVYATNTQSGPPDHPTFTHIPVFDAAFDQLFQGKYLGDALPKLPSWTTPGLSWAPSVWSPSSGRYVMYYATADMSATKVCGPRPTPICSVVFSNEDRQCISRATASRPAGPFVDRSKGPMICPVFQGGAIDPSIFVSSSGKPYILWKSDGERYGLPTVIYSQPLTRDGLDTAGPPTALVSAQPGGSQTDTELWSQGNVEAPSMIQVGSTYWLFHSEGAWDTSGYNIGLDRCTSVGGPCTNPLTFGTWLRSRLDPPRAGPGGQEFFSAGGTGLIWMIYAAYLPGQSGPRGQRRLYILFLNFVGPDGQPVISSPALGAAMAEIVWNLANPRLPSNPTKAYLALASRSRSPLAKLPAKTLVADGRAACQAFGTGQTVAQLRQVEKARGLDAFGQYAILGFAAAKLCPSQFPRAVADLKTLITRS